MGAALLAGCTPRVAPLAPETQARVRLEPLLRQHTLWPEVERLGVALERTTEHPPLQGAVALGEGAAPDGAALARAESQARERRARARKQLEQSLQVGLASFLAGESERLEILLTGQRSELESAARRQLAEAGRTERERADASLRTRLERLTEDLALLRTTDEALDAQLREGFVIGVTGTTLAEELKKLGEATATLEEVSGARRVAVRFTPGVVVSPRARLTASRDAIRRLVRRLEMDLERTREEGEQQLAAQMERLRKESAQRIDRQIAQLREQRSVEIEPILQRQELADQLERTLGLEAAPARSLAETPALAGKIPALNWPTTAPLSGVEGTRTALRVQRERLIRWIRADVMAAVEDLAQTHRMRVVFAPEETLPDETDTVAQWLKER